MNQLFYSFFLDLLLAWIKDQESCQEHGGKARGHGKAGIIGFFGLEKQEIALISVGLLGQFPFFGTGNGDLIELINQVLSQLHGGDTFWRIATPGKRY